MTSTEEIICKMGDLLAENDYTQAMSYTIYPKEVGCKTHAFFEHMVIHVFEDELKAIGATNVRCNGMID